MAVLKDIDKADLEITGPAHHKLIAALEGVDPITRIEIGKENARFIVTHDQRVVEIASSSSPDRHVVYILAGAGDDIKKSDDILMMVSTLIQTQGADSVIRHLASGWLNDPKSPSFDAIAEIKHPARETPSEEAARRWRDAKQEMLKGHKSITASDLADMTGSTARNRASRANEWSKKGKIFGVHDGRQLLYPIFQIKEDRPNSLVEKVLRHLRPRMTEWEIFSWFTTPDGWSCRGRRPMDLMNQDPDAVLESARHQVVEQWD